MSLEEDINFEIASCKKKFGSVWGKEFFNNFDFNLPGGGYTRYPKYVLSKILGVTGESELKSNQTGYQFQEVCKEAVLEFGLTLQEFLNLRQKWLNEIGTLNNEFFEALIPIYIILRKRGYNHYPDLTA